MADALLKALDKRIDANEKAIKAVEKNIDKRISNLEGAVKALASALKGKLDTRTANDMDQQMYNKLIVPLIGREAEKITNKLVKEARITVIENRLNIVEGLAKAALAK